MATKKKSTKKSTKKGNGTRRTFDHVVRRKLNNREIGETLKALADAWNTLQEAEEDHKVKAAESRANLKTLRKEVDKLAVAVKTGESEQEVECFEKHDERLGVVNICRADNGQKVDERAMTADERQTEIPGTDAERPDRSFDADAPPEA